MHRWIRLTALVALVLAIPALGAAEQLEGFKMPDKGKKGVFSPGLIRGYTENQVIPFKANIDPVDLEDAAERAIAEGSSSTYLITVMIPTYSDHAPPRPTEANAESECLFGVPVIGAYPHAASVSNYKFLPVPSEAPQDAKDYLKGGGAFTFGVVAYQPAAGEWEGSDGQHIGVINLVVNRFFEGHPVFPNGVTGLRYDVHFDITDPPTARGRKDPPPLACTIQYGVRLSPPDLPPIVPPTHPDYGGAPVPGACSFHPGPGLLHAAYEVQKPTGRATVPIKCTPCYDCCDAMITVTGTKWDDSNLDHTYDMGDAPIAGVVIELRDGSCGGIVLDADTTDEFGRYELKTIVDCGTSLQLYVVEDSAGSGQTLDNDDWVQTTPQTDCNGQPILADWFDVGDGVYVETIENIQADLVLPGRNFGNIPPKEICFRGTKWCDIDLDHRFDGTEIVLEGVKMELRDGGCEGDLLASGTTDARGGYEVCTDVRYGTNVDFFIVENSTGPGEALDVEDYWSQTTPQTDCHGQAITAEWFPVGYGVYIEQFQVLGPQTFTGRDFGNARLRFGDVGERTPGFWCSQVHLEQTGQGGSQPCNDLIRTCGSDSAEERLNKAIHGWEANCTGPNQWIFADRTNKPHQAGQDYSLEDLAEILCPQDGEAEHHQFARQLLALLANVTDCPCLGEPCGSVGSPNCLLQLIWLHGQVQSVEDALELACDGNVTYEDLAAINENRITLVVADCGE